MRWCSKAGRAFEQTSLSSKLSRLSLALPSCSKSRASAQEPRGQEQDRAQKLEDTADGDAHELERQRQQPHERVEHERKERERPAQYK